MFTPLDAGSLILFGCFVVVWHQLPLFTTRLPQFIVLSSAALTIGIARAISADISIDTNAACFLIYGGIAIGRQVLQDRRWPVHALTIALACVTATGTYLRAYRLDDVIRSSRPLFPDVVYYHQHALETGNPFAAGYKSPLWSSLHSPLLRWIPDPNVSMRLWSWLLGIAMLPLVGLAMGKLLHGAAGVLTAGLLATEPYFVDLCCDGLREEAGVCLWMVVLLLLLAGSPRRLRGVAAGIAGGLLLLLRNISIIPWLVLTLWSIAGRRWKGTAALAVLLLPLLIVAPFYLNQYRAYGDAFAMEKRDARYHANLEFRLNAPPTLSMPTSEAYQQDLFAGEPLSPAAYLLRHRPISDFATKQWTGMSRIITGQPFDSMYGLWWRLICAAGVIASACVSRARFIALFVVFSMLGISAHLLALVQLELRLLLPVLVMWLAAGCWLTVSIAEAGLRKAPAHAS